MILISCKNCKKKFGVYPSWLDRRVTCSKVCANKLLLGNKYSLGRKHPVETIQKMRKAKLGLRGSQTNRWKGNKVKYRAIHMWIQSLLGKASYCSKDKSHKASRYHWANKSGEYRRVISDWWSLCSRCNHTDGVHVPARLRKGAVSLAV